MRFVFVGSGTLAMLTGRMLAERGHEVVLIERDRTVIDALQEEIDVGFLHGDGTRPAILREADPEGTDLLFCLTHDDQANIIASLVARSLGFHRVVTRIQDQEFEHVCLELGLVDTIVPEVTVARHLADVMEGADPLELSATLGADARLQSFVIGESDAGVIDQLELPGDSHIICLYRDGKLLFAGSGLKLRKGDKIVVLARIGDVEALRERWSGAQSA